MKLSHSDISAKLPIITKRLVIRKVGVQDAGYLFRSYTSDPEVTLNSSWRTHTSIDETKSFIQYCLDEFNVFRSFNLCICLKHAPKRPIGMIKIKFTNNKASLGYVLAKKYWNQGITTEAVKACIELIFSFPDIKGIEAFTDVENLASITVLKKAGFTYSHQISKHIVRPQRSSELRDSVVYVLHK